MSWVLPLIFVTQTILSPLISISAFMLNAIAISITYFMVLDGDHTIIFTQKVSIIIRYEHEITYRHFQKLVLYHRLLQ